MLPFQSAMRIFCCSNGWHDSGRKVISFVSIRHADFLLFELVLTVSRAALAVMVSIRHADFLLFERARGRRRWGAKAIVSIRHADFLLFEP